MKLSHDGVHWHGTFDVVLGAMLTDLLSDDPIDATIVYLDDNDGEITLTGTIEKLRPGFVKLTTGEFVNRDRILSVVV